MTILITTGLALFFTVTYTILFKTLTKERWQFLAAVPAKKNTDGSWEGRNLTFYGVFIAAGTGFSLAYSFLMMGSLGITYGRVLLITALTLAAGIPAVKIIARIVERRKNTITIGGGAFAGLVTAPWIIKAVLGHFGNDSMLFQTIPALAVLVSAYAFGEGIGRLSCISFGCCYGKPLSKTGEAKTLALARFSFTFTEETRKACYASGLSGVRLFPIQALTAAINTAAGISGMHLIITGSFTAGLLVPLCITQLWRFLSEFLRADYRGGGMISPYQIMSLSIIPYYLMMPFIMPSPANAAVSLKSGLAALWRPETILIVQAAALFVFLYTGVSSVTSSTIRFKQSE